MGFFDLSIPYTESGGKEANVGKALRLKLATIAMQLGYVGIAHNRLIEGVMSDKDSCKIPLLTLGSLVKLAPKLASSVGFHRDLLGIPKTTPFRQYTRLTVKLESNAQCLSLNSGNPILKSYDIVAVMPLNQNSFNYACEKAEVDLISIDFADKTPFRLNHSMVKAAIQRGIYFEIKYSDLLMDAQTRRQFISNAKLLVDWTRGKNLIISSGASSITEIRGPNDVINLVYLLGLSSERAKAAISKNCRSMIAKVLKKKRFNKEAVRIELLSSTETFSLDKPLSEDCMKWDPLSSGEGDMLLDDIAKAFDATTAVSRKSPKAIDFASVLDGLPSHGFRVGDIVGTNPVSQPIVAKVIDEPVASNQFSELHLGTAASSDDNLREIKTVSDTDMQISDDNSKVEPIAITLKEEAVGLRKCSTSKGQELLFQNQVAASSTLIRCTKLKAACDVNMLTQSDSEDKSLSPSKSGHESPKSLVENMETIAANEVSVDCDRKEGTISGQANNENNTSDDMKLDCSSEVIHEDMEVVGEDHDQVSALESNETVLREETSVPYTDKEGVTETEINQEAHVQSTERNNGTNSVKAKTKRSRVGIAHLKPFNPLLQSHFKRRKHRRA